MSVPGGSSPTRCEAIQTLAAVGLCLLACFRAIVAFDPFPYFSSDPFQTFSQVTSLTPATVVALDAAAIVLASLVLIAHRLGGGRLQRVLTLLGVLGGIMPVLWLTPARGLNVDQVRLAFSTLAAFWSAIALAHACADPRRRRLCLAVLLGVSMMLLAKGVVQVLVEHRDTLAWYRRDPESFLRAQGWEPGSAQARAYERRLRQPEATGWFGLSNVFATVMAAGAVGMGAMASGAIARIVGAGRRSEKSRALVRSAAVVAVASLMCVVGVLISGSKGGLAAMLGGAVVVGLALAARTFLARRERVSKREHDTAGSGQSGHADAAAPPRSGRSRTLTRRVALLIAVGLMLAPLSGVVLRGLVGERLGELSILFRWFYMQGAARIIADHPFAGVGPAGFRDAYMLVKPALAAEDVTSPHSLSLDLLSAYGVPAGLALLGVVVLLAATAVGRVLRQPTRESENETSHQRGSDARVTVGGSAGNSAGEPAANSALVHVATVASDTKALALGLILATMAAGLIERPLLTPEVALSRLAGLALWVGAAWGVIALGARSSRAMALAACGAVAAMVLHAGIEMTPIWPNAQAWFLATLGAAGGGALAGTGENTRPPTATHAKRPRLAIAAIAVWTALMLAVAPWWVIGWQSRLQEAWDVAAPVGRLRGDLDLLSSDPALAQSLGITPESMRLELAELVGQPPATSPDDFDRQLNLLLYQRATQTQGLLDEAVGSYNHAETLRSAGRAAQHRASAMVAFGDPASALTTITDEMQAATWRVSSLDTALAWSHLASLGTLRASLLDQLGRAEDARAARALAIDHYRRAAALDPHGVFHPVRLARLAAAIGDSVLAEDWAERALQNHANTRLDPVIGLSDAELREMEHLASPPAAPTPRPTAPPTP